MGATLFYLFVCYFQLVMRLSKIKLIFETRPLMKLEDCILSCRRLCASNPMYLFFLLFNFFDCFVADEDKDYGSVA